jgi:hypothetical protein
MEDGMTTNEFYYLLLVLGAFGAFAIGVSLAMAQYKTWRRRQAVTVVVSRIPQQNTSRPPRVSGYADAA